MTHLAMWESLADGQEGPETELERPGHRRGIQWLARCRIDFFAP